jgi:hypothetical protein
MCSRTRAPQNNTRETTAEVLAKTVLITQQVVDDENGDRRYEYMFTCLVCKYTDTYTTVTRARESPLREKAGSLDGETCTRCARRTSEMKNGDEIEGLCGECAIVRLYRFMAKHVEEFDVGVAEEEKMGARGWFRKWLCMG